ncbi:hypothetical protein NDK25_24790 [Niallia taxi]|nr:hypothetical protein [Niallia taxi]MDE5055437.1 hypothetical protein [Niallia taxi]
MRESKLPVVIAIAAVSGGGKTTIATDLNQTLKSSKILYFDNYNSVGPINIIEWVDKGANYNEWNLNPLIEDLKVLLSESIDYIILDYPFAYRHTRMSEYIDLTVFIDTPLDIALARRVTRDFKNSSIENILSDMDNYIAQGRRGYLEMLKNIKPNSDIILDGTLPRIEIAKSICKSLKELYK